MKKLQSTEIKVGLFALGVLAIILFATVRVSQEGLLSGGTYSVYVLLDSAEGLTPKTPIEIAGINVGALGKTELVDGRIAKAELHIKKGIKLTDDVVAQVRTKGFLGESYIDLKQGSSNNYLEPDDTITATNPYADLSQLSTKLNEIAGDVSEMTKSVKTLFTSPDGDAPVTQMVHNMRDFTKDLKDFTQYNKNDMNRVVANLAALTNNLRIMIEQNRGNVDESLDSIRSIAQKIDEGRGTLGKLVNDETTIDNLNQAIDNLNETLGGVSKMQLSMGYHLEYLGSKGNFKNYVSLGLAMRPDRRFLFDFVGDSNPPPDRVNVVTDVTVGGNTTQVETEREIKNRDKFLFSAQIAQDWHDLTLRAGIIESRAGLGVDWSKSFFKASVSVWDFRTDADRNPHMKGWGTVNLTPNIFVLGGIDDPLNTETRNWFFGAGFQFVDNDVKSLLGLGLGAGAAATSR